jgi:hypothetical protein
VLQHAATCCNVRRLVLRQIHPDSEFALNVFAYLIERRAQMLQARPPLADAWQSARACRRRRQKWLRAQVATEGTLSTHRGTLSTRSAAAPRAGRDGGREDGGAR